MIDQLSKSLVDFLRNERIYTRFTTQVDPSYYSEYHFGENINIATAFNWEDSFEGTEYWYEVYSKFKPEGLPLI